MNPIPVPVNQYTPVDVAKELLKDITFVSGELTLEPCAGRENRIYNLLPEPKARCEIEDDGGDFFQYTGRPHKIISNPPFHDKNKKNISVSIIEHCFKVCLDEVWILINHQTFNSLTPCRLHKYIRIGWKVVFIRILNIPCWYGRYYFICFKKGVWPEQTTKSYRIL